MLLEEIAVGNMSAPMQHCPVHRLKHRLCSWTGVAAAICSMAFGGRSWTARGDDWLRIVLPIGHNPAPGVRFTVTSYRLERGVLSADALYSYSQGGDSVVLHGRSKTEGLFQPRVSYEVATKGKTEWRLIEGDDEQPTGDNVVANPSNPIIRMFIRMEPFSRWIGIYRYGRITLETGDFTIVALEDLLPTGSASDATGNFKDDVAGNTAMRCCPTVERSSINGPAAFTHVISLGGELTGEFAFDAGSRAVGLSGRRIVDGDFWPEVILDVGDCDSDWQRIGTTDYKGDVTGVEIPAATAEIVRVSLSLYKPFIGRRRLGRLTFSTGQSTIFCLDLLAPKT